MKIDINAPCHENWDGMGPNPKGKHFQNTLMLKLLISSKIVLMFVVVSTHLNWGEI